MTTQEVVALYIKLSWFGSSERELRAWAQLIRDAVAQGQTSWRELRFTEQDVEERLQETLAQRASMAQKVAR